MACAAGENPAAALQAAACRRPAACPRRYGVGAAVVERTDRAQEREGAVHAVAPGVPAADRRDTLGRRAPSTAHVTQDTAA